MKRKNEPKSYVSESEINKLIKPGKNSEFLSGKSFSEQLRLLVSADKRIEEMGINWVGNEEDKRIEP